MNIFNGYEDFVDILGDSHKLGFLGFIYMHLRAFP